MSTPRRRKWSFSELQTYETCPLQRKFKYLDRVPETRSAAADEGTRKHTMYERATKERDLSLLLESGSKLEAEMTALLDVPTELVFCEQTFSFDENWRLVDNSDDNRWLVVKPDVIIRGPNESVTIDHKSGTSYGKEITHYEQGALYTIAEWRARPEVTDFTFEVWYHREGKVTSYQLDVRGLERQLVAFDSRVKRMMDDQYHQPRPNKFTCAWCAYNKKNSGVCPVAAV